MKRPGLTPLVLLATLFLAPNAQAAETMTPAATDPSRSASAMSPQAQELLKRFDENGDGKLDDDERADAHDAAIREQVDRQMARLALADGDADALRHEVLKRFDKNHDGRIDADERADVQKFVRERAGTPEVAALREQFMKRFDSNHDGRIEPEERAAVAQFFAGRVPKPATEEEMKATENVLRAALAADAKQRERFDRNDDGKLDDTEWAVARTEIARWFIIELPFGPAFSAERERRRLDAVAGDVADGRKRPGPPAARAPESSGAPAAKKPATPAAGAAKK